MIKEFDINEITTIVNIILESKKQEELCGYSEEEYDFPSTIYNKINKLTSEEYISFIERCESISEEVEDVLSGELNMLHRLNEEVRIILENEDKLL